VSVELAPLDAAAWWLDHGFALLPCQPGSKALVRGFGPHQQRVVSMGQAVHWWGSGSHPNLAVVSDDKAFILDFDDVTLYESWFASIGELAVTYTEHTPRGGRHAFYHGTVPRGITLRDGAELKTNCLVAPSTVDGKSYRRGGQAIRWVDATTILSPLSKPGSPTPHLLRTIELSEAASRERERMKQSSRVTQIKAHFRVLPMLEMYVPHFATIGEGRFVTTRCPFHKGGRERNPSMWIDLERQTWGCHACGEHGDVINLYAKLRAITNREAIQHLAELLP
jgi:hypothetical protein